MALKAPVSERVNDVCFARLCSTPFHLSHTTSNENHIVAPALLAEQFAQKNPTKKPSSLGILAAQWLEHPTCVTKVVSSIRTWSPSLHKLAFILRKKDDQLGPVVQKPINANPRLKIFQGVYFSTPKCCSTLIFGKTLQ